MDIISPPQNISVSTLANNQDMLCKWLNLGTLSRRILITDLRRPGPAAEVREIQQRPTLDGETGPEAENGVESKTFGVLKRH